MDLFAGVTYAFARIRVRWSEFANDCRLVPHSLFVRALDDNPHLSVCFQCDPIYRLYLNSVAET